MAAGVYKITEDFESVLSKYTGAPHVICVDNMSNALFLCLMWWKDHSFDGLKGKLFGRDITIPARTYPSVPCEILHAGFNVNFEPVEGTTIKGPYRLKPTPIWDSALRFTKGMYVPGQYQCISFTGPRKHLKLSKGGAILTDNAEAAAWFKKARFSGRAECDYHLDNFDDNPVIGWNMYMLPELAARGLLMMQAFPDHNEDLEIPYPDLSQFKLYNVSRPVAYSNNGI